MFRSEERYHEKAACATAEEGLGVVTVAER